MRASDLDASKPGAMSSDNERLTQTPGKDARCLVVDRRRKHHHKPYAVRGSIERLVPGPYLELFALNGAVRYRLRSYPTSSLAFDGATALRPVSRFTFASDFRPRLRPAAAPSLREAGHASSHSAQPRRFSGAVYRGAACSHARQGDR
jgi:hypothetical protein